MDQSCVGAFLTNLRAFDAWLGGIIQSLFPWPAVILFVLLYPPLRRALAIAFANMLSTLHSLKVAGMELTLDPEAAQAMAAKSTVVVQNAYEHEADDEVRRRRVWEKFTWIVEQAVRPLAQSPDAGFRSTIHIKDILQPDTLYQLVEYYHAAEPSDPHKTRGRRISIRAGIGGRAWRLKEPLYANVPDDVRELVEHWGMTSIEAAALAEHGRQSFAVIPVYPQDHPRYPSDDPAALIFIDAKQRGLFDATPIERLNDNINAAARDNGFIASLVQVTRALAEDFQSQTQ
jgi:hypothetical protein